MAVVTNTRTWLFTFVAAIGLAAYTGLVLLPAQKTIAALRRDLQTKEQFVANMSRQKAAIADMDQSLGRIVQQIEGWRKNSPAEPNLVEMLGKVAQLAAEEKLQIVRLMPQTATPMASLRQHPLTLEVAGDFTNLMAFLGRVEQLPETIWVRQVILKPNVENRETVQCELILSVFADNREISG